MITKFLVRKNRQYDMSGYAEFLGEIGAFDSKERANKVASDYNADKRANNSPACFDTAEVFSLEFNEWAGSPLHGSHYPEGVTDSTRVCCVFRNGQVHRGSAQAFGWEHRGINDHTHIVAYRVIG
jgi:hypothetical protein